MPWHAAYMEVKKRRGLSNGNGMVVLVLLGMVERVVQQNGGKAGKEKTWRRRGSGVEIGLGD
jgi:hypothetical protein